MQKALSPVLSPCNAMMRNFYQTSTTRPYQYGATGASTTPSSTPVPNSIRYPTTPVGYSQFSPLTAAGIRQVNRGEKVPRLRHTLRSFRTIHSLFKTPIGTTKVSQHFALIIHQCSIIQLEQFAVLRVLPFHFLFLSLSFSFHSEYISLCVHVCAILFDE